MAENKESGYGKKVLIALAAVVLLLLAVWGVQRYIQHQVALDGLTLEAGETCVVWQQDPSQPAGGYWAHRAVVEDVLPSGELVVRFTGGSRDGETMTIFPDEAAPLNPW